RHRESDCRSAIPLRPLRRAGLRISRDHGPSVAGDAGDGVRALPVGPARRPLARERQRRVWLETMVKRAPRAAAAVASILLLLGCQADPPCGLRTCDISQPACQKIAAQAAACLLGQPAVEVPIELVTRQQL